MAPVDGLTASVEKMRSDGVADAAVETFRRYYEQLRDGDVGALSEADLEPIEELPDAEELPSDEGGARDALDRAVVLKLNGGLGTSMGLEGPKSMLQVKDGLTFLDVIVRQVLDLRRRSGARLPLVLMNSFATRDETLAALERHPDVAADVPLDFVQNKVPKLRADDLQPVSWPDDPALEWAPPGHGDLYTAMVGSGMLETLLDRGYRYAFVSNSDNLGAVLDPRILAWFAREEIPFLMEVADRTEADRKGGHLAGLRGGGLVLRESAQTPRRGHGRLPGRPPPPVLQHQHAMGQPAGARGRARVPRRLSRAADDRQPQDRRPVGQVLAGGDPGRDCDGRGASASSRARGPCASRGSRFAPVKTTNDLLAVRSDAYVLTDEAHVELAPERQDAPPIVDLDSSASTSSWATSRRASRAGPPSLVACDRLTVVGRRGLRARRRGARLGDGRADEAEEQLRADGRHRAGGGGMSASSVAGRLPDPSTLIDVDRLVSAYYDDQPDPSVAEQRVSFGTSGHRGSSPARTFNEAHVLAISEAVCRYRASQGIDGPLFLGRDTHALSEPAFRTILEVLAAHEVDVMIDADDGFTPTPVISHAILTHNRGGGERTADGIVVTPSHNPPEDGGFKYNPPHGGPAGTDVTSWIEREANGLLDAALEGVQARPVRAGGRGADRAPPRLRLRLRRRPARGRRPRRDPRERAAARGRPARRRVSLAYWEAVAERHGLDLTIVNDALDPTFALRARRLGRQDPHGLLLAVRDGAADGAEGPLRRRVRQRPRRRPARDRHARRRACSTPTTTSRPASPTCSAATATGRRSVGVGKTLVSSSIIDRVAGRPRAARWSRCRSGSSGSSTGCSTARSDSAARRARARRSCAATARCGRPTRTG